MCRPHPGIYNVNTNLDNRLESTFGHWHVFEMQPRQGSRIAYDVPSDTLLGRSFIVKYARLLDF